MSNSKKKKSSNNSSIDSLPLFLAMDRQNQTVNSPIVSIAESKGAVTLVGEQSKGKILIFESKASSAKKNQKSNSRDRIIKSYIAYADALDW